MKRAFLKKFFAADFPGERRRLTTALICARPSHYQEQVTDYDDPSQDLVHRIFLDDGSPLGLDEPAYSRSTCSSWAIGQARQIQRTILEVFLRCFELAVGAGCRTVEQIIDHWRERSPAEVEVMLAGTIGDLVHEEGSSARCMRGRISWSLPELGTRLSTERTSVTTTSFGQMMTPNSSAH